MLKQILKLEGVQKLEKKTQVKVNAGKLGCNAHCSYAGQSCYSGGHCGCPGVCISSGGLRCVFF